jgi:hypothetical protein
MNGDEKPLRGLDAHGIHNVSRAYWNLTTPSRYEEAIRGRVSGRAASHG